MPNKNKNETLIAVVLLMVLLVILLPKFKQNAVLPPKQPTQTDEAAVGGISNDSGQSQEANVGIEGREAVVPSIEYTGQDKKDPLSLPDTFKDTISGMFAPKPESIILPALAVSGIVWGGPTPQAIINGKILKEGDLIEEAEVIEIRKREVILLYKGREFNLSVSNPNVPK